MTPERRHHLVVAADRGARGRGDRARDRPRRDRPRGRASRGGWASSGVIALVLVLLTAPDRHVRRRRPRRAREGWAEFRRELRRSRRGVRPMTLAAPARAEPTTAAPPRRPIWSVASRRLHGTCASSTGPGSTRAASTCCCPSRRASAADALLGRLRRAIARSSVPEDVRIATFPDDGLTSGALISAVHGASLSAVPTPIRAAPSPRMSAEAFETRRTRSPRR